MNKRIEQMALRAGGKKHISHLMSNPPQERVDFELWNEGIEKFANLIIEECCNILEGFDCQFEIETIKDHFGDDK